jgi:hypothetical protein
LKKTNEIKELHIQSVTSVYDPNAAKKWMKLYMDVVKQELLKQKVPE